MCGWWELASYADDTNVSQKIQHHGYVYRWPEENNMQVNAGKFQTLHNQFSNLNERQIGYTGRLDVPIPEPKSVRVLGIDINNEELMVRAA